MSKFVKGADVRIKVNGVEIRGPFTYTDIDECPPLRFDTTWDDSVRERRAWRHKREVFMHQHGKHRAKYSGAKFYADYLDTMIHEGDELGDQHTEIEQRRCDDCGEFYVFALHTPEENGKPTQCPCKGLTVTAACNRCGSTDTHWNADACGACGYTGE